jgi:uncharacterized protein (DUF488 family)
MPGWRNIAPQSWAAETIFTMGHSTRTIAEFVALLREVEVDLLVDIRSVPRSRTNPRFNADALPEPLAGAGIAYRHLPALGGLRHRRNAPTCQFSLRPNSSSFAPRETRHWAK